MTIDQMADWAAMVADRTKDREGNACDALIRFDVHDAAVFSQISQTLRVFGHYGAGEYVKQKAANAKRRGRKSGANK